jgi:GMP synthase-like glutamine amidotransferase
MATGSSVVRGAGKSRALCLVVQHLEPEGPYAIAEALVGAAVCPDVQVLSTGGRLPANLDGYSGVVVMGGPMSATSEEGFPTRAGELGLLEQALQRGLPALGVCLGAQLLAVAAGGKVYPGAEGPEIGWAPVSLSHEAAEDPLFARLPEELTVLHWHHETLDLPPRSTHLASSELYANQAFRTGPRAWGLQFHLEADSRAVDAFLSAFSKEAEAQGAMPQTIAAQSTAAIAAIVPARRKVFDRFASLVSAAAAS